MQPIKIEVELVLKETDELKKSVAKELDKLEEDIKKQTKAAVEKGLREVVAKYIGNDDEKD